MPLYEYVCLACGEHTELVQRVSAPPLATCPHCGGSVRKVLAAPALQFKGSGWYVTDYGRGGGGSGSSAQGDGNAKATTGEGKTEGGAASDTKPS